MDIEKCILLVHYYDKVWCVYKDIINLAVLKKLEYYWYYWELGPGMCPIIFLIYIFLDCTALILVAFTQ